MLGFPFGVACGAKRFEYFTSKMRVIVFLRSRDLHNRFFHVKMIQNEIFNVFRGWKYEFLRICWGPTRARSPQGPTRAQGPAGPDPRRALPGPRAPQGPIPAVPHQGPGPRRARSLQCPTRAQGPAGPDPCSAPPGPRAPQGPIPGGPHQGPGEGLGEGPPGPRARCAREARARL